MPVPPKWNPSLREILTGVLITSAIFATAVFIPWIGLFSALIVPLPILFYRAKLGRQAGFTIGMISGAIVVWSLKALGGSSADILFLGILYFGELLFLGYVLSELLERRESIEKTIGYTCAAVIGSALIIVLCYNFISRTGLTQLVSDYWNQSLEMTLQYYKSIGISKETIDLVKESLDHFRKTMIRIIPGVTISMLLIVIWSNLLMAKPLFERHHLEFPDFGKLNRWRVPDLFIWVLIICGAITLLPLGTVRLLGINGLILMFTVYFFQGIAIVAFIFERKAIPRPLRIFIYSMIALQQILLLAIVGLGVFDMWLDVRKLNAPKA